MANPYHPLDPRRNPRRPSASPYGGDPYGGQPMPTLEDYEKLVEAYQDLQGRFEIQTRQLREREQEVAIRDEVLRRQSEEVRKIETELVWTRAAQLQAEKAAQEAAEKVTQIQSQLQNQGQDQQGWQERYTALQSEVESLRQRWEQRYTALANEARNQILLDMLPLADHLDLALQHAGTISDDSQRSFVVNIESTRRAFLETLRRYGVERMDVQGVPFDPNLHEAVGSVVDGETPNNQVIQVVQAGYMDGEKLLRPARVVISAG